MSREFSLAMTKVVSSETKFRRQAEAFLFERIALNVRSLK